jgi:putative CocE/NonD family hydrolase
MVADQRYAFTRPDVLSFESEVLDADLTIAGPILANLFVSTTGTDADWFVKIIDVHPHDAPEALAGQQALLGFEVMRGKYRNSFAAPEPFVPGEVTRVSFNVWDKFHTFRKGHRIMVQVHSSWFPFFDRNPQVFTNIYRATPAQFRAATHRVHRSRAAASHLVLPVFAGQP